jgi:hypothetical protein
MLVFNNPNSVISERDFVTLFSALITFTRKVSIIKVFILPISMTEKVIKAFFSCEFTVEGYNISYCLKE